MMPKIFSGCLLDVMMVVTPAPVAISAAMIFVSMPPVPRLDPRVVVLTDVMSKQLFIWEKKNKPCDLIADIDVTTSICFASGSFLGFEVYRPSTSVNRKR